MPRIHPLQFHLSITLGNDQMRTRTHVRAALQTVSRRLEEGLTEGRILDLNGNGVGTFGFSQPVDDEEEN